MFDRLAVPLTGAQPWLSIHGLDRTDLPPGRAAASRGLVVRSWRAVLDGQPAPLPHACCFCTEWGKANYRTVVEIAPPPGITHLRPRDFIDADLELLVFPADATSYYGTDTDFQAALARDADSWRLVCREVTGNALQVESRRGTVLNSYPLRIAVDDRQAAEVSLRGGLGYVPVSFVGLAAPDGYAIFVDDQRVDQSVHGNDFWQTDYDPVAQRWRQTYNLRFTAGRAHTLRLQKNL